MSSILSRFRKRRTNTLTSLSPTPATSDTPPTSPVPFLFPQLDRKILDDPDSFLANFPEELEDLSSSSSPTSPIMSTIPIPLPPPPEMVALTPSTRKGSGSTTVRKASGDTDGSSPSLKDNRGGRFVNRMSMMAGREEEWLTFGRQRERSAPALGEFGEQFEGDADDEAVSSASPPARAKAGAHSLTPDSSPEFSRSSGTPHTTSTPSHKSPVAQEQEESTPSDIPLSKHKSTKATSRPRSKSHSRSRSKSKSKSRSRSKSTTHSPSNQYFATPPSHDPRESPQTFGHPTPPSESRSTGSNGNGNPNSNTDFRAALRFEFERASKGALPALAVRSKSKRFTGAGAGVTGQMGRRNVSRRHRRSSSSSSSSSFSPPDASPLAQRLSPNGMQNTYPPHRRSSQMGTRGADGDGGRATASLPFNFGKPFRAHHSNRIQAQQIFTRRPSFSEGVYTPATRKSSTPGSGTTATRSRSRSRSRLSSGSSRSKRRGRRTSADWNAQQATEDVGSWPALVSKEILRLSLGGGGEEGTNAIGPGGSASESGREPDSTTRADNVPTVPNLRHGRHESLISPVISTQLPSSSLGPPSSFQGNDVDRNLSDLEADQLHGRFGVDEVEEVGSSMPVKEPPPATDKKILDPSTPVPRSSSPPTSLQIPPSLSVTSPTPETSPHRPSVSAPVDMKLIPSPSSSSSALRIPTTTTTTKQPPKIARTPSDKSKGKRKADDSDITPPDHKKDAQHATFAPLDIRTVRISDSSHAPSSYQNKRARISSPLPSPSQPREASSFQQQQQQAAKYGSWSSRASSRASPKHRTPSRAASSRSAQQQQHQQQNHQLHRASSDRRSISQMSIPISALVSPHAPSISRSSKFHMQDPRKPPRKRDTGWSLRFRGEEELGSPVQAWFFFVGFVLFPLWWAASIMRTPKTRRVGGSDTEKAVTLDDPQVEHDAKVWRFRCRIMTAISFFTYIPFIVLIAVFAPR